MVSKLQATSSVYYRVWQELKDYRELNVNNQWRIILVASEYQDSNVY